MSVSSLFNSAAVSVSTVVQFAMGLVMFQLNIIRHLLITPLYLALYIVGYTVFVKIPVVLPLRYLLELDDEFRSYGDVAESEELKWLMSQVQLFVLEVIHFGLASIVIGVFVGAAVSVGLRVISVVFNEENLEFVWAVSSGLTAGGITDSGINNSSKGGVSGSGSGRTGTGKTFGSGDKVSISGESDNVSAIVDIVNTVLVPPKPSSRVPNDGLESTLRKIRQRRRAPSAHIYEDDDGYNYTSYNRVSRVREEDGKEGGVGDIIGKTTTDIFTGAARDVNEETTINTVEDTIEDIAKTTSNTTVETASDTEVTEGTEVTEVTDPDTRLSLNYTLDTTMEKIDEADEDQPESVPQRSPYRSTST
ncbi:uncharacterized protein RJT21DRAFT_121928 [Scheffersomyces amazonensis]|uniref:uncharacterized protein n=1 Tax=Scheffersomyces amazonensis TaxID=1078765 RepID=UPI00315D6DFB